MALGKKILIGLGILFLVIIAIIVIIGGAFLATIGKDISEKEQLLEGLAENQRLAIGNMIDSCQNNSAYLQSPEIGERIEKECMKKVRDKVKELKGG